MTSDFDECGPKLDTDIIEYLHVVVVVRRTLWSAPPAAGSIEGATNWAFVVAHLWGTCSGGCFKHGCAAELVAPGGSVRPARLRQIPTDRRQHYRCAAPRVR